MAYEQKVKKLILIAFIILNVSYLFVNKLIFGILVTPEQLKSIPQWFVWLCLVLVMAALSLLTYKMVYKANRAEEKKGA